VGVWGHVTCFIIMSQICSPPQGGPGVTFKVNNPCNTSCLECFEELVTCNSNVSELLVLLQAICNSTTHS
jgi:hypothetical protein